MLILSLECAASACGVCVWNDGVVLAELREEMKRGQDRRLIPLVLEAMEKAGVAFDALDRIAVTKGPGSFTGLRIGLAAARGIGLAAGKPVIGIDRFSIYRQQGKDQLIVLASQRTELFCQFYPAEGDALEPVMMRADEIDVFLAERKNILLSGDGLASCVALTEQESVICASLAALAHVDDPAYVPRPLYLRAPDVTVSAKSVVS